MYTCIVFDQVIPIVDYSLYVVTGQTLALAWELPHRPIVLENMLFDPLPPQQPVVESVPVQQQVPLPPQPPRPAFYQQPYRRVDSYYYGDKRPLWQPSSSSYANKNTAYRNPFSYYNRQPATTTTEYPISTTKRDPDRPRDIIINDNFPFIGKRKMAVLPMGKRSAPDEATADTTTPSPPPPPPQSSERLALRHHRQSRYDLYRLIEVYLTA